MFGKMTLAEVRMVKSTSEIQVVEQGQHLQFTIVHMEHKPTLIFKNVSEHSTHQVSSST